MENKRAIASRENGKKGGRPRCPRLMVDDCGRMSLVDRGQTLEEDVTAKASPYGGFIINEKWWLRKGDPAQAGFYLLGNIPKGSPRSYQGLAYMGALGFRNQMVGERLKEAREWDQTRKREIRESAWTEKDEAGIIPELTSVEEAVEMVKPAYMHIRKKLGAQKAEQVLAWYVAGRMADYPSKEVWEALGDYRLGLG